MNPSGKAMILAPLAQALRINSHALSVVASRSRKTGAAWTAAPRTTTLVSPIASSLENRDPTAGTRSETYGRSPISPLSGRSRRRGTHHEGGRQPQGLSSHIVVGNQLQYQFSGPDADRVVRNMDGGEWRVQLVREQHVVVTDHRYIVRHSQPPLGQYVVASDREQIVAGHNRREINASFEKLGGRHRSWCFVEPLGEHNQPRIRIQPLTLHPCDETLISSKAGREVLRAANMGDLSMPERNKVPDRHSDPGVIVTRNTR